MFAAPRSPFPGDKHDSSIEETIHPKDGEELFGPGAQELEKAREAETGSKRPAVVIDRAGCRARYAEEGDTHENRGNGEAQDDGNDEARQKAEDFDLGERHAIDPSFLQAWAADCK